MTVTHGALALAHETRPERLRVVVHEDASEVDLPTFARVFVAALLALEAPALVRTRASAADSTDD